MSKSGFVAVVGRPNVGKSTMLNQIMGEKLSITSKKAQTTRNKITLIHTSEEGQIIFLDTPGISRPKNKLGDYMLDVSLSSLKDVDVITMVVDHSPTVGPMDGAILEELKKIKGETPMVLVINKVDQVVKEELLPVIGLYDKFGLFREIIPLSALNGENIEAYLKVLYDLLPEGPAYYPADMVTDQPEKIIVAELIREQGLRYLQEEVPHGLAVSVNSMKEREDKDMMDIGATIYVERDSHKAIVIGKGGQMLKKIGTGARKEIEAFLGIHINLSLWVKVSKNWRDKDERVRQFGYR